MVVEQSAVPLDLGEPVLVALAEFAGRAGFAASQGWRARARCRGADPEIFAIERGERADEARSYCRECSVRLPCLEYALTRDADLCRGVWGGLTGRQRRWGREHGRTAAALLAELG